MTIRRRDQQNLRALRRESTKFVQQPNIRNLTNLPQVREEQRDYSDNEDDDEEEYDTAFGLSEFQKAADNQQEQREHRKAT
eukprot:934586-Amphidinium_carterae.2